MTNLKAVYAIGAIAVLVAVGGSSVYLASHSGGSAVVAPQTVVGPAAVPAPHAAEGPACSAPVENCSECTGVGAPGAEDQTEAPVAQQSKKLSVDADKCVGCGKCVRIAPDVYQLDPVTGKAKVVNPQGADKETIQRTIDNCPVGAIEWK
ncbi:MAG: ferredoxin [Armatimonadetes bacterium]|nr:ferredoxin [Armatimonadota bacterium]